MTINVTQEHIREGQTHSCDSCPVALAITAVTGPCDISVLRSDIIIKAWRGKTKFTTKSPACVTEFIRYFDNGAKLAPFSFELDIPKRFLK